MQQMIVVTGIGLVTSLGLSLGEVGERSLRGESGIDKLRLFDVSGRACGAAAQVSDFELSSRLNIPKNEKFMSRGVAFATLAAKDAIAQSNFDIHSIGAGRIGMQLASGQPGLEPAEFFPALTLMSETGSPATFEGMGGRPSRLIDRYFPLRTLANAGAGLISSEITARGPGNNFAHSDTASAVAISTACYDLAEGRCDIALAGGYDSLLTPSTYLAYEGECLLSAAAPDRAYRPFDRDRDGIVLGEGAAVLVLERAEDAVQRGSLILGEIAGCGNTMEISDSSDPIGSEATLRAACEQAMQDQKFVDFAIAHGLGTVESDRREAALLSAVFGSDMPVTALKSQTGYVGAATAAVEVALGLYSLQRKLIPPIARHQHPGADCRLNLVSGAARKISPSPSFLCINWSWTGQCTAVLARTFRQ
jgi:3-oxoacyl-[acyl-carrier-protein] synthase II